jgi:hypothetical protein
MCWNDEGSRVVVLGEPVWPAPRGIGIESLPGEWVWHEWTSNQDVEVNDGVLATTCRNTKPESSSRADQTLELKTMITWLSTVQDLKFGARNLLRNLASAGTAMFPWRSG